MLVTSFQGFQTKLVIAVPVKVRIGTIIIKGTSTVPSQQGPNRAPSDRQPQEAEEDVASEGDTTLNQKDCSVYSAKRTWGIQQEHVKLRYKTEGNS
jgi:hypothetical protein